MAPKVNRKLQIETQLSLAAGNLVANGAGVSIDRVTAYHLRSMGLIETRPFVPAVYFYYYVLLPGHKPLSRLGEISLQYAQRQLQRVLNETV